VFPSQDSLWPGIGKELLESDCAFQRAMVECDRAVRRVAGWSLLEELHRDGARTRLDDVGVAQALVVPIQVSLPAQWRAWGVEPDRGVGANVGEVAAAQVAGVLTIDEALYVACRCARSEELRGALEALGPSPGRVPRIASADPSVAFEKLLDGACEVFLE